jgi:ADP-heptose:LPS heptosyltransferase
LTLPLAKVLKENFPGIKIVFLGKHYTKPVIDCCEYIDEFIEVNDFLKADVTISGEKPQAILHVFPVSEIAKRSKKLKIPLRIGTTNRLYHWATCNKLVRLSRKNSDLHEAQLNLKLLSSLNIRSNFSKEEIQNLFGFTRIQPLEDKFRSFIDPSRYNLILHPKSQGSAREWGLENFIRLIKLLDKKKYHILISGTEKERDLLDELFNAVGDQVTDITGKMQLSQFISFIDHCDGLVANSTGPLHVAAILGKHAFGIYPSIRPMHPGRWAPIGKHALYFEMDNNNNSNTASPSNIAQIIEESI